MDLNLNLSFNESNTSNYVAWMKMTIASHMFITQSLDLDVHAIAQNVVVKQLICYWVTNLYTKYEYF